MDEKQHNEDEEQHGEKDLRIDYAIGGDGPRYRATHVPSGVFAESDSVREAVDAVNSGMEETA